MSLSKQTNMDQKKINMIDKRQIMYFDITLEIRFW